MRNFNEESNFDPRDSRIILYLIPFVISCYFSFRLNITGGNSVSVFFPPYPAVSACSTGHATRSDRIISFLHCLRSPVLLTVRRLIINAPSPSLRPPTISISSFPSDFTGRCSPRLRILSGNLSFISHNLRRESKYLHFGKRYCKENRYRSVLFHVKIIHINFLHSECFRSFKNLQNSFNVNFASTFTIYFLSDITL